MRIDLEKLRAGYAAIHATKASQHGVSDRTAPSLFQYDYLVLSALRADLGELLLRIPPAPSSRLALDIGSGASPYRADLIAAGFEVRTLDVTADAGADYVGTAEATHLPDASFDLVLCTQVLEHCERPWIAIAEAGRVLRPGGHCLFSVPHVWFYHPHPGDFWRFTQEGVLRLCAEGGLVPAELRSQGGTALAVLQVMNFALYGLLGKLGAPIYAGLNVIGLAADRVFPNDLFSLNFFCLARKQ